VGSIKSAVVNYSQNGVSMGTATVTFRRSADADRAVRDYDGAEVDGKPMVIKLIGQLSTVPVVVKKRKPQPQPQQPLPVAVQPQQQFGLGVGAGFGLPAAVAPAGVGGAAAFNPFAAGLAFGSFPPQQFAGGFNSSFPQQQKSAASTRQLHALHASFHPHRYRRRMRGFMRVLDRPHAAAARCCGCSSSLLSLSVCSRGAAAAPARGNAKVSSGGNARGGAAAGRGGSTAVRGGRGAARGGRGAGGRGPVKEPTQSELDAELDAYQGSRADGDSKTE
jgi:hypothetical protein